MDEASMDARDTVRDAALRLTNGLCLSALAPSLAPLRDLEAEGGAGRRAELEAAHEEPERQRRCSSRRARFAGIRM